MLVKQLKEAVSGREVFYVSCYTWVGCEAGGRATIVVAATTATGGEDTRKGGRGVAIMSTCGGGAACAVCRAGCEATGVCS